MILVIIIFGTIRLFYFPNAKGKARERNLDRLQRIGTVIRVSSQDLKIKSRETEVTTQNETAPDIAMLDSFVGKHNEERRDKVWVSVVYYETEFKSKAVRFVSDPINADEEYVRSILSQKAAVHIYVNPNNSNDYVFDLKNIF